MRSLGQGVTYHERADVGLPPNTAPPLYLPGVKGKVGHYTTGQELGRDDIAAWARQIDYQHRVINGWENGFAYCWGVARDRNPELGHIIEGRAWSVGGHTRGHNSTLVAFVFFGNDDLGIEDLTPGVKRALAMLDGLIDLHLGRSVPRSGHRDWSPTACPGDEMYRWWTAPQLAVPEYRGSAGHVPEPLPTVPRPNLEVPHHPGSYDRAKPTMSYGYVGTQVVHLQRGLNLFDARLLDDGVYGRNTARAVKNFQRWWGLTVDGIYGPQTAGVLDWAMRTIGY